MLKRLSFLFFLGYVLNACATNEPPRDITVPYTFPDRGGTGFGTSPITTTPPTSRTFISNKFIKLGIDPNLGGAITYLSEIGQPNLVNNFDYGRQIQNSLYAGPSPYSGGQVIDPRLANSSWNPVQAGDWIGNPARSIEMRVLDSTRLYVKSRGIQWHLNNVPAECVMEHWYEIRDNTVRVRSRTVLQRADTTFYNPMYQEAPAVYLNGPYHRFVFYGGANAFTNDALTVRTNIDRPTLFTTSECWAALLNTQNRGLGVYCPNLYQFANNFFGQRGEGGEFDNSTSYMTGLPVDQIDYNGVYEYEYVLIVGSVDDIRRYVYSQPRPRTAPDFVFENSRQGWSFYNTRDQGWPIRTTMNVRWQGTKPERFRVSSPFMAFSASSVPKLYIQAAFSTNATTAHLIWTTLGDKDFRAKDGLELDFPIIGDGQMRVYEIDMSRVGTWQGLITRISIEPTNFTGLRAGGQMRLRSVTTRQP